MKIFRLCTGAVELHEHYVVIKSSCEENNCQIAEEIGLKDWSDSYTTIKMVPHEYENPYLLVKTIYAKTTEIRTSIEKTLENLLSSS